MARLRYVLFALLLFAAACAPQFDAPQVPAAADGLPVPARELIDGFMTLMQRTDYAFVSAENAAQPAPIQAQKPETAEADEIWCVVLALAATEDDPERTWRMFVWREDDRWVDATWVDDASADNPERAAWDAAGCTNW